MSERRRAVAASDADGAASDAGSNRARATTDADSNGDRATTDAGSNGDRATTDAGSDADGRLSAARVLVVDNYDSFAYNLVQYVGEVADEVVVRRNDAVDLAAVRELDPAGIVVSPGPGTPAESGISVPLFAETDYPILGVCLGHQALCAANGAPVGRAPEVVHGKPSTVAHDGEGIFAGLPDRIQVGRYHSLAVEREDLPDALVETASTADEREVLMAVRHREKPHVGVQFHPESILTREADAGDAGAISLEVGKRLVENFCDRAAAIRAARGGPSGRSGSPGSGARTAASGSGADDERGDEA